MFTLTPFRSLDRDFGDILDVMNQDFPKSSSMQMSKFQDQALRLDVKENADSFQAIFDVPGVPKDAVKISHEGNNLTVSVDHKEERSGKDGKVHWRERSSGFASRTITLPENCDLEKGAAKQEHGVLTITVPKHKQAEKKKYITIQ